MARSHSTFGCQWVLQGTRGNSLTTSEPTVHTAHEVIFSPLKQRLLVKHKIYCVLLSLPSVWCFNLGRCQCWTLISDAVWCYEHHQLSGCCWDRTSLLATPELIAVTRHAGSSHLMIGKQFFPFCSHFVNSPLPCLCVCLGASRNSSRRDYCGSRRLNPRHYYFVVLQIPDIEKLSNVTTNESCSYEEEKCLCDWLLIPRIMRKFCRTRCAKFARVAFGSQPDPGGSCLHRASSSGSRRDHGDSAIQFYCKGLHPRSYANLITLMLATRQSFLCGSSHFSPESPTPPQVTRDPIRGCFNFLLTRLFAKKSFQERPEIFKNGLGWIWPVSAQKVGVGLRM